MIRKYNFKKLDGKEILVLTTREIEELVMMNDSSRNNSSYTKKHFRIACPRCTQRDLRYATQKNLSISSDFTIGYCFRCELTIVDELKGDNKELDFSEELYNKYKKFELIRLNCNKIKTSEDINKSDEGSKYIVSRNKYYDLKVNQFNLKWKNGKVIIPYYDLDSEWYYYQFRYMDPSKSPTGTKYYNPPIDSKGLYLTCELDKKIHWDIERPTIIVEGALTAIALKITIQDSANVIGLIGKTLTNYQLQYLKILNYSDLYLMLDETELSNKVKETLSSNNIESKVIESDGRDAEELLMQLGIEEFRDMVLNKIRKKNSDNIELSFSIKGNIKKKNLKIFNKQDVRNLWIKEEL